jgi:hypothetical protein
MPTTAPAPARPLPELLAFWHGECDELGHTIVTGYWYSGLIVEVCKHTNPTNSVSLFRTLYDTQSQTDLPDGAAEIIRKGWDMWSALKKPTYEEHATTT